MAAGANVGFVASIADGHMQEKRSDANIEMRHIAK